MALLRIREPAAKRVATAANFIKAPRASEELSFFSMQIAEARRFYLRAKPSWSRGFHLLCGGSEMCSADYRTRRDDFPYTAIEFVVQGEGTLALGGKTYTLMPGAIFAYGPGVGHDIRNDPRRPMTKYFVTFAGRQAAKHLLHPGPKPGEIVQTSAPEDIAEIFEQLIDAGKRETPFRERLCWVISAYLLLRIAESAVPLGSVGTAAFETFQRCRRWVDHNYRRFESLEEIAAECRLAEGYICRLFKRYSHQSPWQYVLRLKMRDAAHRLQAGDSRVSDVAYEFGFGDPFQFSRTFRKVLGVSPRQFLRLHRQGS